MRFILPTIPLAAAIAVFGTIFGAAASALIGPALTIAASLLIFSGAVQLALVGLLIAGAAAPALLLTAVLLNLRNLLLGAVLRPHLPPSPARRALLGWFVVDEAVGLALTDSKQAEATLLAAGILFYISWQLGTILGILGGAVVELQPLATALFPVLFVGLAAIAATRRDLALRAIVAALLTLLLAMALPTARTLAPVIAALIVALPGNRG